jgi:hypothetical protein
MFLVIPLGTVVVFAALAGAASCIDGRSELTQALMLLATLSILTPAIARIPWEPFRVMGPPLFLAVTDTCVLALVAYDTWRNRRLHPAFLWERCSSSSRSHCGFCLRTRRCGISLRLG